MIKSTVQSFKHSTNFLSFDLINLIATGKEITKDFSISQKKNPKSRMRDMRQTGIDMSNIFWRRV